MSPKNIIPIVSVLTMMAGVPRMAPAQTAPAGWQSAEAGQRAVFTPPDLGPSEFYQITVYPRAPLAGMPLADFVDGVADRETAALGKESVAPIPAQAKNPNTATTTHTFVTPQGQTRVAVYTALSLDGDNARVVSVVLSDLPVFRRYQPQMQAVVTEAVRQEKAAGKSATTLRGVLPGGMTPGGKVVPGIYEGDAVFTGEGQQTPSAHFRLYLYGTGELRLYRANGDQVEAGADDYSYDPVTGKMNVGNEYSLNNFGGLCFYGRSAAGQPYLYAQHRYSEYTRTTTLRYVGPPGKLSDKQQAEAKEAADAEARRYKYVTAPGRGLQPAQIEGIFHHLNIPIFGLSRPDSEDYLLLKDGTVHYDLPVAPDEMDIALSRRKEPKEWGRWRRQGEDMLMEWPDHPGSFEAITGSMMTPGKPGERLSGRYGGASSGGSFATGGYYAFYGVTFTPDGRFSKDESGGMSSSGLGHTLNDFSVSTTYDNEQSSTTFSGPSVVGAATSKAKRSGRAGTYSVSGYVLTLHYDNGKVERQPFFFLSKERYFIYFNGSMLKSAAYK